MESSSYLTETASGIQLKVKVQPRASRNQITITENQELKIRVTAPPVDSAANTILINLLARRLACPRSAISLIRGRTSRHKVLLIRGVTAGLIRQRLS